MSIQISNNVSCFSVNSVMEDIYLPWRLEIVSNYFIPNLKWTLILYVSCIYRIKRDLVRKLAGCFLQSIVMNRFTITSDNANPIEVPFGLFVDLAFKREVLFIQCWEQIIFIYFLLLSHNVPWRENMDLVNGYYRIKAGITPFNTYRVFDKVLKKWFSSFF